jgi:hypothetical protein
MAPFHYWIFIDQTGYFENTPLYITWRRQSGEKAVWKAERAWFLDRRERRAKPGIEPLLTRWGKSGMLSNHFA